MAIGILSNLTIFVIWSNFGTIPVVVSLHLIVEYFRLIFCCVLYDWSQEILLKNTINQQTVQYVHVYQTYNNLVAYIIKLLLNSVLILLCLFVLGLHTCHCSPRSATSSHNMFESNGQEIPLIRCQWCLDHCSFFCNKSHCLHKSNKSYFYTHLLKPYWTYTHLGHVFMSFCLLCKLSKLHLTVSVEAIHLQFNSSRETGNAGWILS